MLNCNAGVLRESLRTRARLSDARLNRRCAPVNSRSQYKPVSVECDLAEFGCGVDFQDVQIDPIDEDLFDEDFLKWRTSRVPQLLSHLLYATDHALSQVSRL